MPYIFAQMGGGAVMGFLWFLLLFIAGITSSVSADSAGDHVPKGRTRHQPRVGDRWSGAAQPPRLRFCRLHGSLGTLDEMDFWAGTMLRWSRD